MLLEVQGGVSRYEKRFVASARQPLGLGSGSGSGLGLGLGLGLGFGLGLGEVWGQGYG